MSLFLLYCHPLRLLFTPTSVPQVMLHLNIQQTRTHTHTIFSTFSPFLSPYSNITTHTHPSSVSLSVSISFSSTHTNLLPFSGEKMTVSVLPGVLSAVAMTPDRDLLSAAPQGIQRQSCSKHLFSHLSSRLQLLSPLSTSMDRSAILLTDIFLFQFLKLTIVLFF